MKSLQSYILPLFCAAISACAQFEHQTAVSESHALATIRSRSEFSKGYVKSLDGMPVKEGATYRMRPGNHEIVVESTDSSIQGAEYVSNSYGTEPVSVHISDSGQSSIKGQDMLGRSQNVDLTVDKRLRRSKGHSIKLLAGKHYELTGDRFTPCRPSPY